MGKPRKRLDGESAK